MEVSCQFSSQNLEKVPKECQSDCSNLSLLDDRLLKGNWKLAMYIKLNLTNITLLLQEASKTKHQKVTLYLTKCCYLFLYVFDLQRPLCPSTNFRSNRRQVFCKEGVLKKFKNSQKNSTVTSTGVFLSILQNLQEFLFGQTSANNCF